VVTTSLGKIRGYFKTSHDGRKFSAFEGVPFAKPPIGNRRFEVGVSYQLHHHLIGFFAGTGTT
jgi:carboxylesterase type B